MGIAVLASDTEMSQTRHFLNSDGDLYDQEGPEAFSNQFPGKSSMLSNVFVLHVNQSSTLGLSF